MFLGLSVQAYAHAIISPALGVQGAIIPGGGANYMTEPDTTTFWSRTFKTDGDDGFTDASGGNLSPAKNLAASMALSGNTLPQVNDPKLTEIPSILP